MPTEEKNKKLNKFFQDPDWVLVEQMIREHIDPLHDVSTINVENTTADAVMAEVAGRQMACKSLDKFLTDCRIIGKITKATNSNFK